MNSAEEAQGHQSPGEDEPIEVDALLFGDPGRTIQLLGGLQHLSIEPLDQLLLRGHVQPLLLQVVGQSLDVWLHHLHRMNHRRQGLLKKTKQTDLRTAFWELKNQ